MRIHHPDDYFPPGIHRRLVPVCQASGLYISHVGISHYFGLLEQYKQGNKGCRQESALDIHSVCHHGSRLRSHVGSSSRAGKVDELSAGVLLYKALIAPMGPYWYLHTLILCNASYFLIYKVTDKWKGIIRFIILGIFLYILSELRLLTFANAIYFLAGVAIRQSGLPIIRVFQPSFLSVVPLVILCCFPENLNRGTLAGVAITYLVISLLLATYTYLPEKVKRLSLYIGSNTLVILLFSPVFTILSKAYLPLFAFDATGICFMIVSVIFVICGCFGMTYVLDRLHISPYF